MSCRAADEPVTHTDEVNTALDRLLLGDALANCPRIIIRRDPARLSGMVNCRSPTITGDLRRTVKSRLHYAVRALRLMLQEMGVTR